MLRGALCGALLACLTASASLASYRDPGVSSALPGASTAAPTISGCGSSVIVNGVTTPAFTTSASNFSGTVTEGQLALGCTLTWAKARAKAPVCVLSSPTGLALGGYTTSATALVITHASVTNASISYVCVGD